MLKSIEIVSDLNNSVLLTLPVSNWSPLDYYQITHVDGITPEKTDISVNPYANLAGGFLTGSRVNTKTISIEIRILPNQNMPISELRRSLYRRLEIGNYVWVRLVTDDQPDMQIKGMIESIDMTPFSQDQKVKVDILCPNPYFVSTQRKTLTGVTNTPMTVFGLSNAPTPFIAIVTMTNRCDNLRVWVGDKEGLFINTSSVPDGGSVYISTEPGSKTVSVRGTSGSYSRSLDLIYSGGLGLTFGDVNTRNMNIKTTPEVSNPIELRYLSRWLGV